MKTNRIFVDVENVGLLPDQLSIIQGEAFHVHLFLNEQKKAIPIETWQVLQPLGNRVHLVQMHGTGPNALDFHIAFYLGEIASANPDDFFHIISKDKGFDPLVTHLKSRGIFCDRKDSIAEIPILQPAPATSQGCADVFMERIKTGTRPRKWATLKTHLSAMFPNSSTSDISATVEELKRRGLNVNGARLVYPDETA